jgi:2-(3-amino-3-carboxypropyl)histidine synthase
VPCYSRKNPLPVLEENVSLLDSFKRIGLVATIQYLHTLEAIKDCLSAKRKRVFIGGQILGCDIKNALRIAGKTDCILFVGSGKFHPTAVAAGTGKNVYSLDMETETLSPISEEDLKKEARRRRGQVALALNAKVFGILVSTKTGQQNLKEAWCVKDAFERAGKKALVFAGNELTPDNVLAFQVDAWVNTACPRISEDYFRKPVINPEELQYVSGQSR